MSKRNINGVAPQSSVVDPDWTQGAVEEIGRPWKLVKNDLGSVITATGAGKVTFRNTIAATQFEHQGENLLVGMATGGSITSGSGNCLVGKEAGSSVTAGGFNTFVGHETGINITTGSWNTTLGHNAECVSDKNNQTALGGEAVCDGANQVVLGDRKVTEIRSNSDGTCTLGRVDKKFSDGFFAGTVTCANLNVTGSALVVPSLTQDQRYNLTGVTGMIIFNAGSEVLEFYNGATWNVISSILAPPPDPIVTPTDLSGYSSNANFTVDVSGVKEAGHEGYRLFNGDINDLWWTDETTYDGPAYSATVGGPSFNNVDGSWVRVTLDKAYFLSSVRFHSPVNSAGYPVDWQILYSMDNETWKSAYSVTASEYFPDTGIITFPSVVAKYVVFQCTKVTGAFFASYLRFGELIYA
jgi:hypothetical protein